MTIENDNLNDLERRLNSLHAELRESVDRARSRARRTLVVLILLVLVVCGYWAYIYHKAGELTAEKVTDLAYFKTLDYVKKSPEVMSAALRDRAPDAFDYAEAQFLQVPALVANRIQNVAMEKTQTVLDLSEPRIQQVVDDAIAKAKASTTAAGFDGKDPAQMEKLIDTLVAKIHADMRNGMDKIYLDYDRKAQDVVDYIDKLAAGKGLTVREQHLREVLIGFLALDAKRQANP